MLDHLELSVQNLSRSQEFYRAALAPLGYGLHVTSEVRGFGVDKDNLDFWLRAGEASSPRPHFAFRCATRAVADRGYAAAIAAGGIDNGRPKRLPHIHPNYYAGFVLDLDGHNVEFVCHRSDEC